MNETIRDEFRETQGRFPHIESMREPLTEKQYVELRTDLHYTEEEVKLAMWRIDGKEGFAERFVNAFHLIRFVLLKNRIRVVSDEMARR